MPTLENDLTQGHVAKQLVRYALPLVGTSLLQSLYSIADIMVAGQFIEKAGVSAINNASLIMNMLTQIAIGLTVFVMLNSFVNCIVVRLVLQLSSSVFGALRASISPAPPPLSALSPSGGGIAARTSGESHLHKGGF